MFRKYQEWPTNGFWKETHDISLENQKKKTESKEFKNLIKEAQELEALIREKVLQLSRLKKEITTQCPHKQQYHVLDQFGRTDDYGSWASGTDHVLMCSRCNNVIAKWGGDYCTFDRGTQYYRRFPQGEAGPMIEVIKNYQIVK